MRFWEDLDLYLGGFHALVVLNQQFTRPLGPQPSLKHSCIDRLGQFMAAVSFMLAVAATPKQSATYR